MKPAKATVLDEFLGRGGRRPAPAWWTDPAKAIERAAERQRRTDQYLDGVRKRAAARAPVAPGHGPTTPKRVKPGAGGRR